jgi:hypothetical protein
MRFLLPVWFVLLAIGAAAGEDDLTADPLAGAPVPLAAAVRKYGADHLRWAYTQRMVIHDRKGRREQEQVARFDPSQPYDVQWTLLEKDGRPATEREIRKHRKDRADRARNRKTLGELLELGRARVVREDATVLVYEVPLRRGDDTRFPPEKFEVIVHVRMPDETLEMIELRLRDSLRVAGVVKVKNGDGFIRFAPVAEGYSPTVTELSVGAEFSVLLIPMGSRTQATRTDFKRVTPYDERFQVKIGPLKAIDF